MTIKGTKTGRATGSNQLTKDIVQKFTDRHLEIVVTLFSSIYSSSMMQKVQIKIIYRRIYKKLETESG